MFSGWDYHGIYYPGKIRIARWASPTTIQFQSDRVSKELLGQGLILFPNDILKDEGLPSLVPRALINHHNYHLYPILA